MADTIAQLAIKTVLDGADLSRGLQQQAKEVNDFARNAQAARQEALQARGGTALDQLKGGDAAGAVKTLAGGLAEVGTSAGSAFGAIVTGAAGVAAAIGGIAAASRVASKEIYELSKLGQRIGTDIAGAGRLTRLLDRGGVEDAEGTLSMFRRRLGEVRQDINGPTAQAFRQLGLNPQQITAGGTEAAFRATIVALGQVSNSFDQAEIAQAAFGKGFKELQEVIRLGEGGFRRAEEQERLFGPGKGTIDAALKAEGHWREVGFFFNDLWSSIGAGASAVFSRISYGFGDAAHSITTGVTTLADSTARLLLGNPDTTDVPTLGGRNRPTQRTAAEVRSGAGTAELTERTQMERSLAAEARQRGLVGANATRQEVEAVRDLVQGLRQQRKALEDAGSSQEIIGQQTREREQAARAEVSRRQADARRERERAQAAGVDTAIGSTANDRTLRGLAVERGLVRDGATQAEVAQVMDLAKAYAASSGSIQELNRLRREAAARREDAAVGQVQAAEEALQVRRLAEGQGMTNARIQERLALERGVSREVAAQLRAKEEEKAALDVLAGNRTPLENFDRQRAHIQELVDAGKLAGDQAALAVGRQFDQLVRGLGNGPSSFGLTGTDSRSREGLLKADDFRVRGEIDKDPQWAVRQREAIERMESTLSDRFKDLARQLEQSPALRRAPG